MPLLGARPDDVDVVVISHAHVDHHGWAERFPRAEVLVGAPDLPGVSDVRGYMTAQLPVIRDLFQAGASPTSPGRRWGACSALPTMPV